MPVHTHSAGGYSHGCRCSTCRSAYKEYRATHYAQHREEIRAYNQLHRAKRGQWTRDCRMRGLSADDARHGTVSGYVTYGCRCTGCSKAMRAYRQKRITAGLQVGDYRHGTVSGYRDYGCRCSECRKATMTAQRIELGINPARRIGLRLRKRMWDALHCASAVKMDSTRALVGCSPAELKSHLEKQFRSGMAWDNYGQWHIDHIKPCAAFDLTDIAQQKSCFHYSNLQPLWAADNMRKGARNLPQSIDNVLMAEGSKLNIATL